MSTTATLPRPTRVGPPVAVDRVACTGHGICAAVLTEHVSLDEWGYPVVTAGPRLDAGVAAAAVRLCPARALRVRTVSS